MDVLSLARMAGRGKPTIHDTTRHCTLATFLLWTAVHRDVKRRDFLLQRGSCRSSWIRLDAKHAKLSVKIQVPFQN
jgi:hypothetical protein